LEPPQLPGRFILHFHCCSYLIFEKDQLALPCDPVLKVGKENTLISVDLYQ